MNLYFCRECGTPVDGDDVRCARGHSLAGSNRIQVAGDGSDGERGPARPVVPPPGATVPPAAAPPAGQGTAPPPAPTRPAPSVGGGPPASAPRSTGPSGRASSARRRKSLSRPFDAVRPGKVEAPRSSGPDPVPLDPNRRFEPPATSRLGGSGPGPSGDGRPAPGGPAAAKPIPANAKRCRHCNHPNEASRRFCESCHRPLERVRTPAVVRRVAFRNPLLRRLLGTTRGAGVDTRTWRQRGVDRGLRGGIRHRAGLSPGSRIGLLAGGAGLVLVIGLLAVFRGPIANLFSPPDSDMRFDSSLSGLAIGTEQTDIGAISDGSVESPLVLSWPGDKVVGTVCAADTAHVIEFSFAETERPEKMRVHISAVSADGSLSAALAPGPRLISLRGDGERCDGPMATSTDRGWHDYDVKDLVEPGGRLQLFVHDRWVDPDAGDQTPDILVIGEVEFLR